MTALFEINNKGQAVISCLDPEQMKELKSFIYKMAERQKEREIPKKSVINWEYFFPQPNPSFLIELEKSKQKWEKIHKIIQKETRRERKNN